MESKEIYKKRIEKHSRKSTLLKNCAFAFLFGGSICLIGQLLSKLYIFWGASEKNSLVWVSFTLILASAVLTGAGVYGKLARVAGAGTLVPVTGFANSVVSSAIDTKSEGLIFGVGSKIFAVAGPVILYSVLLGTVYGAIYYIFSLFS